MSHARLPVLAAVLALALMAAGCGGSSSSSSSTAAGGASAPASTQASSAPASSEASGGSSSDAAFCKDARKAARGIAAEIRPLVAAAATPQEKAKISFTHTLAVYQAIVAAAPSDVKPDLAVLLAAFGKMEKALQQHSWNYLAAAPQLEAAFKAADVRAAGKRVKRWAKANCHG
jgi:hypothetical protein